jgi:enoyl-CoA hydratase/carnithine racemase
MSADIDGLAAAGLELSISGAVATVTLNRPERRNAMTPSMWHGLAEIGRAIGRQEDVRIVVVRGTGPSFCAGIDLRMFSPEGVPGEPAAANPVTGDTIAGYQAGYTWLRDPGFVSVAVVQGHAIGAGFQLALACDLRLLADDAMLCMKEPRLGLVPDLTGTKPLVDIVGLPRAIELCLSARDVGASEAADLRLAEWVVPLADLDKKVSEVVESLQVAVPDAARATKQLLGLAASNTLEQQATAERAAQASLLRSRAQS